MRNHFLKCPDLSGKISLIGPRRIKNLPGKRIQAQLTLQLNSYAQSELQVETWRPASDARFPDDH
jgi:hypothetical protein